MTVHYRSIPVHKSGLPHSIAGLRLRPRFPHDSDTRFVVVFAAESQNDVFLARNNVRTVRRVGLGAEGNHLPGKVVPERKKGSESSLWPGPTKNTPLLVTRHLKRFGLHNHLQPFERQLRKQPNQLLMRFRALVGPKVRCPFQTLIRYLANRQFAEIGKDGIPNVLCVGLVELDKVRVRDEGNVVNDGPPVEVRLDEIHGKLRQIRQLKEQRRSQNASQKGALDLGVLANRHVR